MDILGLIFGNLWRTLALALLIGLGLQTWRVGMAVEARDEALREAGNALGANRTNTAMIAALVAEREGLLLKRAAEVEAANRAVAESQAREQVLAANLGVAIQKIRQLANQPRCQQVMAQAICPEIERELRAP